MSLVETMVAIGIMGIFMGVFAQFMSGQSKQTRVLSEKLGLLDMEKLAIGALSSPGSCSYMFTAPSELTLNLTSLSPTNSVRIPINRPIPANIKSDGTPGPNAIAIGDSATSETGRGIVTAIDLVITEGSGGSYKGFWEIVIDQNTLTGRFKPIRVDAILTADITNLAAATVTSCMGQAEANPGAPQLRTAYAHATAWRWPVTTAMCNPDEIVVSGGGHCYNGIGWMIMIASQPTSDLQGWTVGCDCHIHTTAYVHVWALCAKR